MLTRRYDRGNKEGSVQVEELLKLQSRRLHFRRIMTVKTVKVPFPPLSHTSFFLTGEQSRLFCSVVINNSFDCVLMTHLA